MSPYSNIFTLAAIDTEWSDIDEEDGTVYHGETVIYALTDAGCLWEFLISDDGELLSGSYNLRIDSAYEGYNGQPYSNMVVGDDGNLYISIMRNGTNEVYRLDIITDSLSFDYIGNFGDGVWPGLLLMVGDSSEFDASIVSVSVNGVSASQGADGSWSVRLNSGTPTPYTVAVEVAEGATYEVVDNGNGTYTIIVTSANGVIRQEYTLTVGIVYPSPGIPSTPDTPSTPSTPSDDVTTKSEEESTETTAKPGASVSGDTASSAVSESMGSEIVRQAENNDSDSVVIEPDMPDNVTSMEVTIPGETLAELGEKTDADVTIKTPAGNVTLPNKALEELGSAGGSVTISVEVNDDATTTVDVKVNGQSMDTITGDIKAALPIGDGQVAVLVDADGNETIIQKSLVEDGIAYMILDGSATVKIVDNNKNFDDVGSSKWYSDAVAFASSHELFKGTSASTFSPNGEMTRAMIATVLWRLEGQTETGSAMNFSDVKSGKWYSDAVAWAGAEGIIQGVGGSNFSPNRSVTREQLATMLYRYAGIVGLDTTKRSDISGFTDAAEVSKWSKDAMEWAVAVGLIQGNGKGLNAAGPASRAEVAIILQRLVGLMVK